MERVRAATLMAAAALASAGAQGSPIERPVKEFDIEPDFGPSHSYGLGKHHGGRPRHNERDKKAAQRKARRVNRKNRK